MTDGRREERFPWLAIGGLLAAYVAILSIHIDRPWIGAHDTNGAAWSTAGRNLLHRPFAETLGGPIFDHGSAPLAPTSFYVHHPPLVAWLTAGAFALFGESERSGRLVPICASVAAASIVARLLYFSSGRLAAIVGTLFFILLPSQMYYGRMLNHEPIGAAAMAATCLAAWQWRRNPTFARAALCGVPLLPAVWSCWSAYPFAAALAIGALRTDAPRRWFLAFIAVLVSSASLVLFLLYIRLLRHDAWHDLLEAFGARSEGAPIGEWLSTVLQFQIKLLSPLGLGFVAAIVVALVLRRTNRWFPDDFASLVLGPLLATGLINVCLFRQGAFVHEYYCFFLGVPAALAAGRFVSECLGPTASSLAAVVATGRVVLAAHAIHGFATLAALHAQQSIFCASGIPESEGFVKRVAELIAREFPSDATVLVNTLPHGEHLAYYADRRLLNVHTLSPLDWRAEIRGIRGGVIDTTTAAGEIWVNRLRSLGARQVNADARIEGHRFEVLVFDAGDLTRAFEPPNRRSVSTPSSKARTTQVQAGMRQGSLQPRPRRTTIRSRPDKAPSTPPETVVAGSIRRTQRSAASGALAISRSPRATRVRQTESGRRETGETPGRYGGGERPMGPRRQGG
jgi:hypothetical protein